MFTNLFISIHLYPYVRLEEVFSANASIIILHCMITAHTFFKDNVTAGGTQ
jgi:hypothetical protein